MQIAAEVKMWRKAAVVAVGVLVLVGVQLLQSASDHGTAAGVSQETGDLALQGRALQAQQPVIPRAARLANEQTIDQKDRGADNSDTYNKNLKDPKGARKTIDLIGQNLGSPAQKIEAIRAAIVESGSCSDEVCTKTKESMVSRVEAAAAQTRGSLTAKPVECYHVGCIVDVTAVGGLPLQVLMEQLRHSGQFDWPAPAMYSRPTVSNGRQFSMWVLFNPAALSSR